MDRGAWRATVHRVRKRQTHTHTHTQGEGRQRQIGERRVRRHQKIQKSTGFAEAKAGGSFQKERPTQFRL